MVDAKVYIEHNNKMREAKEAAAEARARKKVCEESLAAHCEQLTALLGKSVTPDNLRAVAAEFESEAKEIMRRNDALLSGAEENGDSDFDIPQSNYVPSARASKTSTPKPAPPKAAPPIFDDDDF